MRLATSSVCAAVAVALLAGCSSSNPGSPEAPVPSADGAQSHFINGHFVPHWSRNASLIPVELRPSGLLATLHALVSPDRKRISGIYASEFVGTDILGYRNPNKTNGPPRCSVGPVANPNGIAVDGRGNLIDPDGGSRSVIVFKGPHMCGPGAGGVADPYGQPSDATSTNAVSKTIVVANIFDTSGQPGSISFCTFAGGCTTNLTNSSMYEVAGVAQALNGDCWVDATNMSGVATLTYFKGCAGSGQQATGFSNAYYGGLDIDAKGNLVSISAFDAKLYVYKACNPVCVLVGGPFTLQGEAIYGHLDKKSTQFVAGDFQYGELDVYKYSPTSVTFAYNFNNGLTASDEVEGAAFNPRSSE